MTEATVAPRKRKVSRRRLSMHVPWSYPAEAGRDLYELSNSNSAMREVRGVSHPLPTRLAVTQAYDDYGRICSAKVPANIRKVRD
jgi:hypothetical protein